MNRNGWVSGEKRASPWIRCLEARVAWFVVVASLMNGHPLIEGPRAGARRPAGRGGRGRPARAPRLLLNQHHGRGAERQSEPEKTDQVTRGTSIRDTEKHLTTRSSGPSTAQPPPPLSQVYGPFRRIPAIQSHSSSDLGVLLALCCLTPTPEY